MNKTQIWICTGFTRTETIRNMLETYGVSSLGALVELWCFAREQDKSGKLAKNFVNGLLQRLAHDIGCSSEHEEIEELFDRGWINWLAQNNLLEKTDEGYQIVFGLVLFEEPEQD